MLEAEAKERQRQATGGDRKSEDFKNQGVPTLGQVEDSSRQPAAVRTAASAIGVSHGNTAPGRQRETLVSELGQVPDSSRQPAP